MAKEFAKPFYNSKEWQKCRAAYISYRRSVDGGMCESCHRVPGYIVHHKIELTPENINDPDIALGFANLKYDCHDCHNIEHMKKEDEPENLVRYIFDETGEMCILPP